MKIIIASPSPYARKARVALREKKVAFEEIIDVPWNANTLTKGITPPQGKFQYFCMTAINLCLIVK